MHRTECVVAFALLLAPLAPAQWLTFNHDAQRTGWAKEETTLSPDTVANLELKWSRQVDNTPLALNALTAPVVANGVATAHGIRSVVYVAGSANRLFGIDAETGEVLWQRTFASYATAKAEPFFLCPNAINATPVIDLRQNLIFVLAVDGRLYGLDLGSGEVHFGPAQLVPPFAKAWSLNLQNGFVFTTTSQFCGGDPSGIYAMQVDGGPHRVAYETVVRKGSGAGMWNRGGTAIGADGNLYVTTGDGPLDAAANQFGSSFLRLSTPDLRVLDYYSPEDRDELNRKDLDLPSGGEALVSYRGRNLLVGGGKDAVVYLLNPNTESGAGRTEVLDRSPRLGNETRQLEAKGFWGSPAFWQDGAGESWIFEPLWGEPSAEARRLTPNSVPARNGAIVALRLESGDSGKARLKPEWISEDMRFPDAPVVANGVVFALATGENPKQVRQLRTQFKSEQDWKQNLLTTGERAEGTQPQTLLAFDAKTGRTLYRSASVMKSWNHFGGLAISGGRVFAVDHDSNVYCFGLKTH